MSFSLHRQCEEEKKDKVRQEQVSCCIKVDAAYNEVPDIKQPHN